MGNGDRDEVADRLTRRFEDDEEDGGEDSESTESVQAQQDKRSKNDKQAQNPMHVKNVKDEWPATSVYLPEFLNSSLSTTYKRADLDFEEEFGKSLQKTRYYYPLVVKLGLERIESMEAQDLQERIEGLEEEAREE